MIFGVGSFSFQKVYKPRKQGSRLKETVDKLTHNADDRGVYRGGHQRTKSDTVEGGFPNGRPIKGSGITEKQERQRHGNDQKGKIEAKLGFTDLDIKSVRDLRNEQFINLERHIGSEEASHAKGGNAVTDQERDPAS